MALLSFACDDEGEGDDDDIGHVHDGASAHPDGHVDEDDENAVPCGDDHPALSPGMSATKAGLTLKLVSGDPTRARKKVRNDWILELVDSSGAPVSDAKFSGARSHMQVHDHPGLPAPIVAELAEPGRVKLEGINFSMRGPWEVYVTVERGEDAPVGLQLKVCVE